MNQGMRIQRKSKASSQRAPAPPSRTPEAPASPVRTPGLNPFYQAGPMVPSPMTRIPVSRPGDPMEREADSMADFVMKKSDRNESGHGRAPVSDEKIQAKCATCDGDELQRVSDGEENEEVQAKAEERESGKGPDEERVQAKEDDEDSGDGGGMVQAFQGAASGAEDGSGGKAGGMTAKAQAPPGPSIHRLLRASRGRGPPLDGPTRHFMESRFGADFSNVRIHTGEEADRLSRSIHAQAFAFGRDIYFRNGMFQPHTTRGRWLLAHELTHTLQQGAARRLPMSPSARLNRQGEPAHPTRAGPREGTSSTHSHPAHPSPTSPSSPSSHPIRAAPHQAFHQAFRSAPLSPPLSASPSLAPQISRANGPVLHRNCADSAPGPADLLNDTEPVGTSEEAESDTVGTDESERPAGDNPGEISEDENIRDSAEDEAGETCMSGPVPATSGESGGEDEEGGSGSGAGESAGGPEREGSAGGSECPDIVTAIADWACRPAGWLPEGERFPALALSFLPPGLDIVAGYAVESAREAWNLLPLAVKAVAIDDMLAGAADLVMRIPEMLPTDKYGKIVLSSFFTRLRRLPQQEKVAMAERFGNLLLGRSPAFFWGLLKGFLVGFLADGLLGIVQMVIDVVCMIPAIFRFLDSALRYLECFPRRVLDLFRRMLDLKRRIEEAIHNAIADILSYIRNPARLFELINMIDERISDAARQFGERAADRMITLFRAPNEQLGFQVGRMIGALLFEIVVSVVMALVTIEAGGVGAAAGPAMSAARTTLRTIVQLVQRGMRAIARLIGPIIRTVGRWIGEIKKFVMGIWRMLTRAWQRVTQALTRLLDRIKEFLDDIFQRFGPYRIFRQFVSWVRRRARVRNRGNRGITRTALRSMLRNQHRRPRYRKALLAPRIKAADNRGHWIVKAGMRAVPLRLPVAQFEMTPNERMDRSKSVVRRILRRMDGEDLGTVRIDQRMNRVERGYDYRDISTRYSESENAFEVWGTINPRKKQAIRRADYPVGTLRDPIPIRWFKKSSAYARIRVRRTTSGGSVREEIKRIGQGIDLPAAGGQSRRIVPSSANMRPSRPMLKRSGSRGSESHKDWMADAIRNNPAVDVMDGSTPLPKLMNAYQIDHLWELKLSGVDSNENIWPARTDRNGAFNANYGQFVRYQVPTTTAVKRVSKLNGKYFKVAGVSQRIPLSSADHGTTSATPINRGFPGVRKRFRKPLDGSTGPDPAEKQADVMAESVLAFLEGGARSVAPDGKNSIPGDGGSAPGVGQSERGGGGPMLGGKTTVAGGRLFRRGLDLRIFRFRPGFQPKGMPVGLQRKPIEGAEPASMAAESQGLVSADNGYRSGQTDLGHPGGDADIARASIEARPLPPDLRPRLEEAFGASLEGVRIHDGPLAAAASARLRARAFTVGDRIYFGAGRFQPATREGLRLLAHELAHTRQQAVTGERIQRKPEKAPAMPLDVSKLGDAEKDRIRKQIEERAKTTLKNVQEYVSKQADLAALKGPQLQKLTLWRRALDEALRQIAGHKDAENKRVRGDLLRGYRKLLDDKLFVHFLLAVEWELNLESVRQGGSQALTLKPDELAQLEASVQIYSSGGVTAVESQILGSIYEEMSINPKDLMTSTQTAGGAGGSKGGTGTAGQGQDTGASLEDVEILRDLRKETEEAGLPPDQASDEELLKKLMKLPEDQRKAFLQFLKDHFDRQKEDENLPKKTPSEVLDQFVTMDESQREIALANLDLVQQVDEPGKPMPQEIAKELNIASEKTGEVRKEQENVNRVLDQVSHLVDDPSVKGKDLSPIDPQFALFMDEMIMFRGLLAGASFANDDVKGIARQLLSEMDALQDRIKTEMWWLTAQLGFSLAVSATGLGAIFTGARGLMLLNKLNDLRKLIRDVQKVYAIYERIRGIIDGVVSAVGAFQRFQEEFPRYEEKLIKLQKTMENLDTEEGREEELEKLEDEIMTALQAQLDGNLGELMETFYIPDSVQDDPDKLKKILFNIPPGLRNFQDMLSYYDKTDKKKAGKHFHTVLTTKAFTAGRQLFPLVGFLAALAAEQLAGIFPGKTLDQRVTDYVTRIGSGRKKRKKGDPATAEGKRNRGFFAWLRKGHVEYDKPKAGMGDTDEGSLEGMLKWGVKWIEDRLGAEEPSGHWTKGYFRYTMRQKVKELRIAAKAKKVRGRPKGDKTAPFRNVAVPHFKLDWPLFQWGKTLKVELKLNPKKPLKPVDLLDYSDLKGKSVAFPASPKSKTDKKHREAIEDWLGENGYELTSSMKGEEFVRLKGAANSKYLQILSGNLQQGLRKSKAVVLEFIGKHIRSSSDLPEGYYMPMGDKRSGFVQRKSGLGEAEYPDLRLDANENLEQGTGKPVPRVIQPARMVKPKATDTAPVNPKECLKNMFNTDGTKKAGIDLQGKNKVKDWEDHFANNAELRKRPTKVEGDLGYIVNARSVSDFLGSRDIPELKNKDDKGHLVARRFHGNDDYLNIIPMRTSLNRYPGKWYKMEGAMADVYTGKNAEKTKYVHVNISITYPDNGTRRPSYFKGNWNTVGGTEKGKIDEHN